MTVQEAVQIIVDCDLLLDVEEDDDNTDDGEESDEPESK